MEHKMTSIHEMQSSLKSMKTHAGHLDEDVKCIVKDIGFRN